MGKSDTFELVTAISGKAYKFSSLPKANLLIDFPNGLLIGISNSISCVDCYIPDENQIYHYAGDLHFKHADGLYSINFHSRAISAISFNDAKVSIPRDSAKLCDLNIGLDIEKSTEWFDSLKKIF